MSPEKPDTLDEARQRLAQVKAEATEIIKILTAEQALRAQRVVRQAGRRVNGVSK